MKKVYVYDTTLRDGAQGEGISFTVADKLKITKKLDEFGADYIEAGNPGSNPKDMAFFEEVKKLRLKNARLTAFGSTRRANITVEEDQNVTALLKADTPVVAIFGKSWDFHVTQILRTTLEENLNMIRETVAFFKEKGKEVVFDAEHFFDGLKSNPIYAMNALQAACEGGADWLVLCDTNGGTFPADVSSIVKTVTKRFDVPVGIHSHNDCGMAVANSVMAVLAGAAQVQGTVNGYGERCGNANLCTIIPNLQLKRQLRLVPDSSIGELMTLARYFSELANKSLNEYEPYVGNNAFAHKGGMHIDAVLKNSASFEHIPPELVGNSRRMLMSEVAGRSTILKRIQEVAPWLSKESPEVQDIMNRLKALEHDGYQFEGAEGSFDLVVRRTLGRHKQFFQILDFTVLAENQWKEGNSATAVIKVEVNGEQEITAAEGDGPVNAMDKALRRALELFYPQLLKMRLMDYKVRVIDTQQATAARVRVQIESTDGEKVWGTIGVSTNIIEASWVALTDSIEYFLMEYEKDMALVKENEAWMEGAV